MVKYTIQLKIGYFSSTHLGDLQTIDEDRRSPRHVKLK